MKTCESCTFFDSELDSYGRGRCFGLPPHVVGGRPFVEPTDMACSLYVIARRDRPAS